jgi:uncharacterized membrane protein YkvA (DUF1232 family)
METEFKEFHELLNENLESYEGSYEKIVDYGPELFKLLTKILDQKKINPEIRLKVSAAISYFVIPYDIIPEEIYGPDGYIDDIFICAYVIGDITNDLGYGVLEGLWDSDENLYDVVEECYEKSSSILGDKTDEILKYVGLDYLFEKE